MFFLAGSVKLQSTYPDEHFEKNYFEWNFMNITMSSEFEQKNIGTNGGGDFVRFVKAAFYVSRKKFCENFWNTSVFFPYGLWAQNFRIFAEVFRQGCENWLFRVERNNFMKNVCFSEKKTSISNFWWNFSGGPRKRHLTLPKNFLRWKKRTCVSSLTLAGKRFEKWLITSFPILFENVAEREVDA